MISGCKICGVSDLTTLKYLIDPPYPPKFIGFICNYKKSKRYIEFDKLKKLLSIDKKNIKFVAVLVKPDETILEQIKDLNFDFYQLYDCNPDEIKFIKEKYKKKIIATFTIETAEDVARYELYKDVADIYLFDSKGYEKSMSFNHSLIKDIKFSKEIMMAGNIKYNDNLENFKEITDIIDISGGLETSGLKDVSKIEIFLKKINDLKNET